MEDDETRSVTRPKGAECKKRHFASFEEEMEAIREHPAAKELLDLLKDQAPERTEHLMSELTSLTEQEESPGGGESNEREDGKEAD